MCPNLNTDDKVVILNVLKITNVQSSTIYTHDDFQALSILMTKTFSCAF